MYSLWGGGGANGGGGVVVVLVAVVVGYWWWWWCSGGCGSNSHCKGDSFNNFRSDIVKCMQCG